LICKQQSSLFAQIFDLVHKQQCPRFIVASGGFEPPKGVVKSSYFSEKYLQSSDLLREHSFNIPSFFNKEYMAQMSQRLALIKIMKETEEKENVT